MKRKKHSLDGQTSSRRRRRSRAAALAAEYAEGFEACSLLCSVLSERRCRAVEGRPEYKAV